MMQAALRPLPLTRESLDMSRTLKFRGAEGQILLGEALGDPTRPQLLRAQA